MCATCGCGEDEARVTLRRRPGARPRARARARARHEHEHRHERAALDARTHTLELEVAVLASNDELAASNRRWLAERGITAVNLMSSPGAGKTTLLERTIAELGRPVA